MFIMKSRILLILALITALPCAYSQTQKNKIDYKTQSYDLVFDRPNCILSVIPMESLPKIRSLTIRGELGNDDVSIIFDKCTDLEYLDLKNTTLQEFNITDFSKVGKLRVFKMPSKVTRLHVSFPPQYNIFGDLFKDCYNLESVELPSELVYLQCNLFVNCPKITSITIPAKVKEYVCIFKNCRSLTAVDLSQCSNIGRNWPGWIAYRLVFENCPNIKTIKYQSGKTNNFFCNGEPEGVNYYFSPNPCTVSRYENSTLIFKGEANNDKKNPVKNCTILCPKSMMTHFYVEFDGNNNRVIGLSEITETGIEKALQIDQRRREEELQEQRRRKKEELQEQRRLEEKLELFRQQAEAKRKREADSIAHIQELKENYSSCLFLFASEERFVSCITQINQNAIENEIKTLIDQKMAEISNVIVKGTEFQNQYHARITMEGICDIPNNMSDVSSAIANYAENKIQSFVAERKALNKAYNKAKKKDPNLKSSEFLISYINGNEKGHAENTSSETFVMANVAYSIAPQTSFGLTFGSVKKLGWYASFNGNIRGFTNLATGFKMDAAEYECDQTGTISTLTTEYSYSGDKATSRLGATAGLVYKINDPLSVYIGGGYGYRNVLWKLDSGQWVKCIDDSYRGIAIDAGLVYNIGQLNLSLGVQTIGVKYLEAKIGIGCSFKTLKTR